MSAAWLRFAILELLCRNPEGATIAQLVAALRDYDPDNRVGPIFQALREAGDVKDVGGGAYALTDQGLVSLERLDGQSLHRDVVLPPRAAVEVPKANAQRSHRVDAYHVHRKPRTETKLPLRKPEAVPHRPSAAQALRDAILELFEDADHAMAAKEVIDALPDEDKARIYWQLKHLHEADVLASTGTRMARRYALASRAELLEQDDAPPTDPPPPRVAEPAAPKETPAPQAPPARFGLEPVTVRLLVLAINTAITALEAVRDQLTGKRNEVTR